MTIDTRQPLEALAKANRVRLGRVALKRDITCGRRRLEPIIVGAAEDEVLELLEPVPIAELLAWPPRWGPRRARHVLGRLGISQTLRLHDLSPARRRQLAGAIERAPRG